MVKSLYFVFFFGLIALSHAQMDDDEDSFEVASDGDRFASAESREGSSGEEDGFGGETRQSNGFIPASQFPGMRKRSTENVINAFTRVRRGYKEEEGVVGPVFTHVKTDHDGNFKWGVKHKVGGGDKKEKQY